MQLYKHRLYKAAQAIALNADRLTTLAWRHQTSITSDSHIYNYIQEYLQDLSFVFKYKEVVMDKPEQTISAIQFKVVLYQYGLFDQVDDYLNNKSDITQIIWHHAPTYSLNSDIIILITERLRWPDGKAFTAADMQQLFDSAINLSF